MDEIFILERSTAKINSEWTIVGIELNEETAKSKTDTNNADEEAARAHYLDYTGWEYRYRRFIAAEGKK